MNSMQELIDINGFKKKAKVRYVLHIVFICCLLVLTITGSILSLLLSNLDYTLNLVLNIVVTVLVALFTIFYFFNIFPIVRHYYSYYKNMSSVSLEHRRRVVFLQEIEKKDIDNVTYRVVQFTYSEGEKEYNENLFLLDTDIKFNDGQAYKIDTYHNVIIAYEVL